MTPKSGWYSQFPAPIPVPKGEPLVTLRDAGAYITRLPRDQHDSVAWQAAMHVLIQAADHGGPIEFARLGMVQALNPKPEPVYHSAKNDPVWRNNRKLARDR
ncbi:hypothetical protein [Tardiphaga sp.]|uniref:hypothetical protein n=1 Tax=Tardiphaga sp. TaxID=1926292 RepID=UPI00260A6B5E|nr:hypothetical protein [Tardiphaga sp.]MDB5616117.1 hypothetical protein [Tardiphaga sp.]